MKRVLVTGGAGFVGSALARRLIADGHAVVVLDDFSRGQRDRLPPGVAVISADIRNARRVRRAVEGCDAVYHLAYVQGTQRFTEHPRLTIEVALKGIMNVLDGAEGKELILVSSSEVYQTPPEGFTPTNELVPLSVPDVSNPRYAYGGGKIACEIAALAYADVLKRTVIARIHNAYGPDMGREHVIPQFAERLLALNGASKFPIQGSGRETRSFCYISDCVDALALLLSRGENRGIYHVGAQEEVTIADLAHRMAKAHGRTIRVVPGKLPEGSPPRRLPDITKLRGLGYEPRVSLAEGLPPTLAWYAAHGS